MSEELRVTRRAFTLSAVGGVSALVLTGCDEVSVSLPHAAAERPDSRLVSRVLVAEQQLLDLCRRAARRHHPLRAVLAEPTRFHQEHVRLLTRDGVPSPTPTHPRGPGPRVPAGVPTAFRAVVEAEHRLARDHVRLAMAARSGEVARLVASLSASAAQQAATLGAVEPERLT